MCLIDAHPRIELISYRNRNLRFNLKSDSINDRTIKKRRFMLSRKVNGSLTRSHPKTIYSASWQRWCQRKNACLHGIRYNFTYLTNVNGLNCITECI